MQRGGRQEEIVDCVVLSRTIYMADTDTDRLWIVVLVYMAIQTDTG